MTANLIKVKLYINLMSYREAYRNKPEMNKPVADDIAPGLASKFIPSIQVGQEVSYDMGIGKVIAMKGEYVTILNGENVDLVHIGKIWTKTFNPMNVMWDKATMSERASVLAKTNLPQTLLRHDWSELPPNVQEVMKSGFNGRVPGETKESESESYMDAVNPNGKKLDKSDVEHGMYGGITTDTFFDATNDYEETQTREKKPLSGAQEIIDGKKTVKKGEPDILGDVEKEGGDAGVSGGYGGAVATGDSGVFNAVHNGNIIHKKPQDVKETKKYYSSRYGIRPI